MYSLLQVWPEKGLVKPHVKDGIFNFLSGRGLWLRQVFHGGRPLSKSTQREVIQAVAETGRLYNGAPYMLIEPYCHIMYLNAEANRDNRRMSTNQPSKSLLRHLFHAQLLGADFFGV
jgi:hypothetical protein